MTIARRLQLARCAAAVAALLLLPLPLVAQLAPTPPELDALALEQLELESDFVVIAMQGDMVESAASTMALARATDPDLRAFAAAMVADHHEMRLQLMRTARALHLPVPITLSGRAQARLNRLQKEATGEPFDDAYVELMLRVHRETLAAHLAFAASDARASLIQVSREARLRVHDHLEWLQAMAADRGAPDIAQNERPTPQRPQLEHPQLQRAPLPGPSAAPTSPQPEDASD